jgi:hypothetical protein
MKKRDKWMPVGIFSRKEQRCSDALAVRPPATGDRKGWITSEALRTANWGFAPGFHKEAA